VVRYSGADRTRNFVYVSPKNAGTSSAKLAGWFVDDLDQIMDEVTSRCRLQVLRPVRHPHRRARHLPCEGFSAAWIKDADGNKMAITEVSD
jgi:hypothetical protein